MTVQEQAQELMLQKNYFFRDNYRRMMKLIIVLLVIAIFLSVVFVYLVWHRKTPPYYASTTTGQVIQLHPLSEPVISNQHLLEWSAIVARKAYSFGFLNYQKQLDAASKFFTPTAWEKFMAALNNSGLLQTIKDKKVIMQTVVMKTPVILYAYSLHGRFTWRVQMSVLVTYGTASEQVKRELIVTMDVSRVPVLDTPEGIQVTDFYVTNAPVQSN